jgi:hypothetical protein
MGGTQRPYPDGAGGLAAPTDVGIPFGSGSHHRRDFAGARFRRVLYQPKQLDRFRDRYSQAGAKDDRRDAFVLADSRCVPTCTASTPCGLTSQP